MPKDDDGRIGNFVIIHGNGAKHIIGETTLGKAKEEARQKSENDERKKFTSGLTLFEITENNGAVQVPLV
jgi:hypothetical protein